MSNRRDFLKTSAARRRGRERLHRPGAFAAGADTIKVGLIGCGGRGTGAVHDMLSAEKRINGANPKVEIVAVGRRLQGSGRRSRSGVQVEEPEEPLRSVRRSDQGHARRRPSTGSTPTRSCSTPAWTSSSSRRRPASGPTTSKRRSRPRSTSSARSRCAWTRPAPARCFGLVDEAKKKNIAIVAGTQRRHQKGYLETIKQIHDGAIGDVVAARCYWNGEGIWFHDRQPGDDRRSSTRSTTGTTSSGSAATTSSSSTSTTST